jgi:hypothetical protein
LVNVNVLNVEICYAMDTAHAVDVIHNFAKEDVLVNFATNILAYVLSITNVLNVGRRDVEESVNVLNVEV